MRKGSEERAAMGDELGHIKEVALNAARFLKYKAKFPAV